MRKINLGVVLPEEFNLNADTANLRIIKRRLELSGYSVEVHQIGKDFDAKASDLDFAVVGSPSSSLLKAIMADSSRFKGFASELLASDSVVLAVSNGLHAFGSMVSATGESLASLELLDTKTTFGTKQHVTIAATVTTVFGQLAGVENHNATVELGSELSALGEMTFGVGNNTGGAEGVWKGNFFGTHLHGPVLAMNSGFADELCKRIVAKAGGNFVPGPELARLDQLTAEARAHLLRQQA